MDFIRPIGPVEREVDPVWRVERANEREEREGQEEPPRKKSGQWTGDGGQEKPPAAPSEGPVEGDDGHLHIDIRA